MTRKPIKDAPARVRQRLRADGSWSVWWEPETAVRKLGFKSVQLDAHAPTRAAREARALNDQVDAARDTGKAPAARRSGPSIDELIGDYQRSQRFLQLAPATQRTYREKMAVIARKWGDVPARDITKAVMATWYETLVQASGLRQAQSLLAAMSILMSHAELRGWRDANSNPCLRLRMKTPAPRAQVMGWAQLDALITAANQCGLPSVGLAAALSMLAGQRQADVLAARRNDFAQQLVIWPGETTARPVWVWNLMRSKRKTAGQIMLHAELVPMVAAVLARPAPADAHLIFDERVSRPFDKDLFAKRWQEVRKAAIDAGCVALRDAQGAPLQFRDLRRTFSVTARANGASPADTGDVLGNSAAMNPQLQRTYMAPQFFTAARAVQAVQRPEPEGRKKA